MEFPPSSPLLSTYNSSEPPSPQQPPPTVNATGRSLVSPLQKTLDNYFTLSAKRTPHNPIHLPPQPPTLKRRRSKDDAGTSRTSKKSRPQGTSKSALAEAKSRAEADKGIVDEKKFQQFKDKILLLDQYAEFLINNNPRFVRHSKCGEVSKQKATYNTTYFASHVQTCSGPAKKHLHVGNTDRKCFNSLITGKAAPALTGQVAQPRLDPVPVPSHTAPPCPGLTPVHDQRIAKYLTRSQAAGGGSKPRHKIAQEEFAKPLADLSETELARVCRLEVIGFRWLNFREQEFICAADCLKTSPSRQEPAVPCSACVSISKDPIFNNALSRKLPKDEHLKFTPRGYRAKSTADQYAKIVGIYDLIQRASHVCFFRFWHYRNLSNVADRMEPIHFCISFLGCSEENTKAKHFLPFSKPSQSKSTRNVVELECRTFVTFLH